ncbi:hypothetical protein M2162_000074 [Streptomyces sp. SAI-041]|nr:hypothetical protein [Streptomyces sp. SAI-041]
MSCSASRPTSPRSCRKTISGGGRWLACAACWLRCSARTAGETMLRPWKNDLVRALWQLEPARSHAAADAVPAAIASVASWIWSAMDQPITRCERMSMAAASSIHDGPVFNAVTVRSLITWLNRGQRTAEAGSSAGCAAEPRAGSRRHDGGCGARHPWLGVRGSSRSRSHVLCADAANSYGKPGVKLGLRVALEVATPVPAGGRALDPVQFLVLDGGSGPKPRHAQPAAACCPP